jgi:taurine dioxygenase
MEKNNVSLEVRSLSSALGVEVLGADLSKPEDDEQFETVHQALLNHNVVVLRDQDISPADHVAFSRRFGKLEHHVLNQFLLPEHPEILQVSNKRVDGKPVGLQDAGRKWHSDLSYMKIPSLGSLLRAIELPPADGDTLFGNLYAAYDRLSNEMKSRLGKIMVRHSYEDYLNRKKVESASEQPTLTANQKAQVPTATHPLVRTHPINGRKALFVSPSLTVGIDGMGDPEAQALLRELSAHATQPEFVYRHKWQVNDIVFWDNRSTIHLAEPYDPKYTRHMHRTTIRGGPVA